MKFNRMCSIENLKHLFKISVSSVQPRTLIEAAIQVNGRHLTVAGQRYLLRKPCYIIGFGKAVFEMSITLERVLGDNLQRGVVNIPEGIFNTLKEKPQLSGKIEFIEGAENNLPDINALKGARKIKSLAEQLGEDDTVVVLISGGGSALLPLPKDPINLEEKLDLITKLSKAGADIIELNCVRKQISELKGGGLAKLCHPARVISLILSDVIGDPLDFIASGPTVPNNDNPNDAISILKKYSLYSHLSDSIKMILESPVQRTNNEFIIDGKYENVDNYIIGNNEIAAFGALKEAQRLGFQAAIISTKIAGEVSKISRIYSKLVAEVCSLVSNSSTKESFSAFLQSLKSDLPLSDSNCIQRISEFDLAKGICLIMAGEPTVVVKGNGKGGRNQQLALAFAVELNKVKLEDVDISFLSCGTDGIDGPTDAAGAIATSDLVYNCLQQELDPEEYLASNDCYTFFTKYNGGKNLIKVGHTGTNVMDIHIILIKLKHKCRAARS